MRRITQRGLRKNLEKRAAVGDDESETFYAVMDRKGPGELGTLMEDDLGFYIQVKKVTRRGDLTEISHIRRIKHGDAVKIIYSPNPWVNYWVDLE